ncbi:Oidioi.mRNA.OKI2018_I69.PAR.g10358.t1.cds [Oikopleura dioica]|uniref:Oidioi.mRNA.OKI2018_I69.PAR.g10358.t1.cds n=1 Tax=Oikopleura dioica TaxID=34765 RepID=A0ABN7RVW9_OIKDI|nr:Oidioi.mRNA.OKI2018_I69.PAR.g10358.t1.cds [Oikopleura dioica]
MQTRIKGIKKEVLNDTFGLFFILLIVAGWKTRLCSLILIIWLGCLNFFVNDFWSHADTSMMYDFKRYDFFQTLSVIGGLKILIALGPGHFSLDYEKKGI